MSLLTVKYIMNRLSSPACSATSVQEQSTLDNGWYNLYNYDETRKCSASGYIAASMLSSEHLDLDFAMHQRIYVNLNISPQQLIHYYEGVVTRVVAKTTDGRTVQFPAQVLRPMVLDDGVKGLFELVFNENHQFVSISRVNRSNYSHKI